MGTYHPPPANYITHTHSPPMHQPHISWNLDA